MSNEEVISTILEGFSKIKTFIETCDIEAYLDKNKKNKDTVLQKSKEFVDEIFKLSENVKNSFYEHYKLQKDAEKDEESEKSDTSVPNNILTNGLDPVANINTDSASDNLENDITVSDNIVNTDSHNDVTEKMDVSEIENVDPDKSVEVNKENGIDPLATTLPTDIDNSKDQEPNDDLIKKETPDELPRRPLLRLVDLNKLIDPKQKKSAAFETSIIILSSDEETNFPKEDPLETNTNKKNLNKLTDNSNSKSPENNSLKLSNKNSSSKKSKHKANSDSEDNSNKDVNTKQSDSESEENCRKSRRLKQSQKEKLVKRECMKVMFRKIGKHSEKALSNSSSDSDTEKSRKPTRTRLSRRCKTEDIKLNSKVYVPLPLYQCETLQEVYNKNKECFDIISSERLDSLRRSKRSRNTDENGSSSDAEKSRKKKSKTKSSNDSDEQNESDDEKSSKKHTKPKKTARKNSDMEVGSDEDKSIQKTSRTKKDAVEEENSDSNNDSSKKSKKSSARKEKSDSDEDEKSKKASKTDKQSKNEEVSDSDEEKSNKKKLKNKKSEKNSDSEDGDKSKKKKLKTKEKSTNEKQSSEDESETEKSTKKVSKTKKAVSFKKDSSDESDNEKTHKKKFKSKEATNEVDSDKETSHNEISDQEKDTKKSKNKQTSSDEEDSTSEPKSKDVTKKKTSDDTDSSKGSDDETVKRDKKKSKIKQNIENSDDSDESNGKNKTIDSKSSSERKKKESKSNKISDAEAEAKVSSDKSDTDEDNKKGKKANFSDSDEASGDEKKAKKTTVSSSDSDDEFGAFSRKKENSKKELINKAKKRAKKAVVSDSDESDTEKKNKDDESDSDESKDSNDDSDNKKDSDVEKEKKSSRKRIKKTKDSSEDSEEEVSTRKHIRKVLGKDSLSETTKQAEAEEKERKARIAEKQKKYNTIFEEKKDAKVDKVVLDYDEKTKEPLIQVHKKIVKHLKPHQVSGVQFMYDACFESVEQIKKSSGSGCILAHCMGLGKTLQVITLAHTLLTHSKQTKVEKVMVVCPINTVLNWKSEFKKWLPNDSKVEVYELATSKKNYERQYTIKEWHDEGGVLIIGYTLFRNLSNPNNKSITKKLKASFNEGLVDPGPDLVICDEGHLLKNEKTNLSIAMNRIKTARRIVLTGTPLQNNLKEYWCMVQFIKPNLLGTYKEYMNRFVNPITNGQYTDSTQHDTVLMRKRSHVLHKLLDGVVQRRDYSVLEPYLPPKHEYVLFVKLSEVQTKIYKRYMEKYARQNDGSNRTSFLFTDFQQLQRICTHPRVLLDKTSEKKEKWDDEESEGSIKDFIDDDDQSSSSSSSSSSGSNSGSDSGSDKSREKKNKKSKSNSKSRLTRARAAQKKDNNEEDSEPEVEEVTKEWWQEFCDGDELDNVKNSGKLSLLFEILKECEEIGDKILVFSQSLYALNCIEYFLSKVDDATQAGDTEKVGYKGRWELGLDYFRIDGSSSCDNRAYWCDVFNNANNVRARLFLISTKAGGLGINLVAANRVIIFDVSWNPSHDVQSIYRVYRFGQIKPSYIYRFVTYGAMEMKIYERQVTKQAISKRVIDEQQIDRHYNQNDLQELYKCDLEPSDRPLPLVPKDILLGEMLQKYDNIIYKYHLHQSLLENKEDEGLNEEERKAAWEEFENEKVLRKTYNTTTSYFTQGVGGVAGIQDMSARAINSALMNIVRRDNPTWSEHQIKGIIPALVRQLQVQIEEQDMSMYQRVVQEIQIMNQQRFKESLYQQQMMKLYQQQYLYQKQQQSSLGNMNINPQMLQNVYGTPANFYQGNRPFPNGPSTSNQARPVNDVIELND